MSKLSRCDQEHPIDVGYTSIGGDGTGGEMVERKFLAHVFRASSFDDSQPLQWRCERFSSVS